MKFSVSGKMWFLIISKVTKKQGLALSRRHIFEKIIEGSVKLTPTSLFRIKKVSYLQSANLLKMRLQQKCFHLNIAIFPKHVNLQNTSGLLFLKVISVDSFFALSFIQNKIKTKITSVKKTCFQRCSLIELL